MTLVIIASCDVISRRLPTVLPTSAVHVQAGSGVSVPPRLDKKKVRGLHVATSKVVQDLRGLTRPILGSNRIDHVAIETSLVVATTT